MYQWQVTVELEKQRVPLALISQILLYAVKCNFWGGAIETKNAAKEKEITKCFYKM